MTAVLRLSGVSAAYGEVEAIHAVSLVVDVGETVSIVGANGAGKTTLMKIVSGLLPPTRGVVEFDHRNITGVPAYKLARLGIALVPENRRVFPSMTVIENLRLGAYHRSDHGAVEADLQWVWSLFPILRERGGQLAETLSGGQQQMLAIGRALMSHPRLLLLDEPTSGLSPKTVQLLAEIIREIQQREDLALLWVEQNARLAFGLSARAYVLEMGSVVASGRVAELADADVVRAAYLGR